MLIGYVFLILGFYGHDYIIFKVQNNLNRQIKKFTNHN